MNSLVPSGKSRLFMLMLCRSFLHRRTCLRSLRRRNLTIVCSLSRRLWQSSISFLSTDAPITSNIWQDFSSNLCWGVDVGIPEISKHSLREYWAFAQPLSLYINWLLHKKILNFLTILRSASSFLKLVFISFTSFLIVASSFYYGFSSVPLTQNHITINFGLLSFCKHSLVYSLASILWDLSYVEQKLKSYLELHQPYSCRKHVRSLRRQKHKKKQQQQQQQQQQQKKNVYRYI